MSYIPDFWTFNLNNSPKNKKNQSFDYIIDNSDDNDWKSSSYAEDDSRVIDENVRKSFIMINPPKLYINDIDTNTINSIINFVSNLNYPGSFSNDIPVFTEPEIIKYNTKGKFLSHIDRLRKIPKKGFVQTGTILIIGCYPGNIGGDLVSGKRILVPGNNDTKNILWYGCFLNKDIEHKLKSLKKGFRIVYKRTVFQKLN